MQRSGIAWFKDFNPTKCFKSIGPAVLPPIEDKKTGEFYLLGLTNESVTPLEATPRQYYFVGIEIRGGDICNGRTSKRARTQVLSDDHVLRVLVEGVRKLPFTAPSLLFFSVRISISADLRHTYINARSRPIFVHRNHSYSDRPRTNTKGTRTQAVRRASDMRKLSSRHRRRAADAERVTGLTSQITPNILMSVF